MTKPRRSSEQDQDTARRVLEENPAVREAIQEGPQPRRSGLLGGRGAEDEGADQEQA
jgi:hypothetical protein